jgi:hypothetical protein
MNIIDVGHKYELLSIDGKCKQVLQFVKRQGLRYPGNTSSYPGTTLQDVIHCLLNRVRYLQNQIPCVENEVIIYNLQTCLLMLEQRAAKRRHMELNIETLEQLEVKLLCPKCGHTTCHCP